MKMQGKTVDAKFVVPIVIPRPGAESFVFKAQPLTAEQNDFFKKVCPEPQPEMTMFRGEDSPRPDFKNTSYLEQRKLWLVLKSEYTFLASLEATDDLEWDTVVMDQPDTWKNVLEELAGAGFLQGEMSELFRGVASANGLDNKKIEQATKDFLATQALQNS